MHALLGRSGRRAVATLASTTLVLTLTQALPPAATAAGSGPSVPAPDIPSVPVSGQPMQPRPQDQASASALTGDQQPGGGGSAPGASNPTATPLSPSAIWNVSEYTGDFSWSYPLRVPPAPGDLVPQLALSYSSAAVDGRTSATNNQSSWIGDGWDLNPGFIERSYGGCSADKEGSNPGQKVGDLCWRSDNAVASYPDGGGRLILGANGWREENDDAARVERLYGAGNGARDGEFWKITTVDGTQYFFGSRPDSQSTWTVPVYGDDTGEPCHSTAGFDASSCTQAWHWNLDKIVDRHGNTIHYSYVAESNSYGKNLKDDAVSYIRGGWLDRIDYGMHRDLTGQASGRVLFGTAERCVPGATICNYDKKENFPDVPLDNRCVAATCPDNYSPSFWTTKRLSTITTQVLKNGSYANVERWTLDQQFPAPGSGEQAGLWLKSIGHEGLATNTPIILPAVTFEGSKLANRVHLADNLSPILRYRLTAVVSESGGVTTINYATADCSAAPTNPESNTKRCFPATWANKNFAERTDYFHKYVVSSVIESDRTSANPQQETHYEYVDGAAWHYDTSEFTPPDKKNWNEYRGYAKVRIRKGAAQDLAGPTTMTEKRFYRGMFGDRLNPTGGTKPTQVEDSEGAKRDDHDWLAGTELESITYDGAGPTPTVVAKTISTPYSHGPTATRGTLNAYQVRPGKQRTFTTLQTGRRITETETRYDTEFGLAKTVDDQGDTSTGTDDRCTTTTYAPNRTSWLIDFSAREETVATRCGATPSFPADAITDVQVGFDQQPPGAEPTKGNVTTDRRLEQRPATGPVYTTVETSKFDLHGRPVETANALGKITRTSYTPSTGGPATQTVETNPLGHTVTTTLDPAFGQPTMVTDPNGRKTETSYDALGRAVEVWLPNRPRSENSPNYRFGYQIRNDAATVVTTQKLGPTGRYTSTNTLYDGLLRERQTQTAAVGGGRLITDTRYDSQGRVSKSTQPYFNAAAVDSTLSVANDNQVPGLTTTEYDGASRAVESIVKGAGAEKWRTSTRYGGDRVHVDPPDGDTATTTIFDARGQATALRQYHGGAPSGGYDQTSYQHTPAGQLARITDPAGNRWEYRYDLRARRVEAKDPDLGTSISTYDDAGRLSTKTDARNQKLVYRYDDLGRKTAGHLGSISGPKRIQWTYDRLANGLDVKGQPATATTYDAEGDAYTNSVLSYNALYQPLQTAVTVPEDGVGDARLAGTYLTTAKHNVDGTLASQTLPAIGDLPQETVTHTYDDFGRPLRTFGGPAGGGTVEYALQTDYTRFGETQRIHLGAGEKQAWLSFYYDDHTRQLTRTIVDAELPRPMQADVNYDYDQAGNITSIADTTLDRIADVQCFRYDHLRRLTDAWTPGNGCGSDPATATLAGPAPYAQSWSYDNVGNRLTETDHVADTTRRYSYPAPGQPRPHAATSISSEPAGAGPLMAQVENTFGYDASGNTTARDGQRLDWDADSRLTTVTEPASSTQFQYAAGGDRLLRGDEETATVYLPGQELQLDKASGALTATRYYEHGDQPIAVRTSGAAALSGSGLNWLAVDRQETPMIAIDAESQSVVQRRQQPFGTPRGSAPAFPGTQGFVGGTIDDSTGLTHLGAREYDPALGRFISVDPILDQADPQQFHGYGYANNNPTTFADPSGLKYCSDDACTEYDDGEICYCSPAPGAQPVAIPWGQYNKTVRNPVPTGHPTKRNKPTKKSLGIPECGVNPQCKRKIYYLLTGSSRESQELFRAAKENRDLLEEYKFDWESDDCSPPASNTPGGFNFLEACQRHDFGYRNSRGDDELHDEPNRKRVDDSFYEDMQRAPDRHPHKGSPARDFDRWLTSGTYYLAVRGASCWSKSCEDWDEAMRQIAEVGGF